MLADAGSSAAAPGVTYATEKPWTNVAAAPFVPSWLRPHVAHGEQRSLNPKPTPIQQAPKSNGQHDNAGSPRIPAVTVRPPVWLLSNALLVLLGRACQRRIASGYAQLFASDELMLRLSSSPKQHTP